MPATTSVSLVVAASKDAVPSHLNAAIVPLCAAAIQTRGIFTVALSGGSLPSFLSTIQAEFDTQGVDPKFESWHVLLADERCVPSTDADSNLGALQKSFLSRVSIPESQIYGISEEELQESTEAVAIEYELRLREVLSRSGGRLDLAVLGFGPDGHTCSLFPGHDLLKEQTKWVAAIEDSPKPPPKRITLTFPVLNEHTRHVIFCGAGGSKSPILKEIFSSVVVVVPAQTDDDDDDGVADQVADGVRYAATRTDPAPYPCAMVYPDSDGTDNTLTYVVDADAMQDVPTV